MLQLLVDAGNTSVKYQAIDGSQKLIWKENWLPELSTSKLIFPENITKIWLSTVRKGIDFPLPHNIPIQRISLQGNYPFVLDYLTPSTLGEDRICIATALKTMISIEESALVVSAGTCITYNVMKPGYVFSGGAISPGIRMRYQALSAFTGNLPNLAPVSEIEFPGKSTEDSLHAGVLLGVKYEVLGILNHLENSFPQGCKIMFTGGDADRLAVMTKSLNFVYPDLVLRGLSYWAERYPFS